MLEFAADKMIVHVSSRDLMILHNWQVVKQIIDPVFSNTLKYWIKPLPGFDEEEFPFVVCSGWMTFNIINVREMTMEPLIEFFGKNNRGLSQEGAVLVKEDFGFSMYFDTTSTTDSGKKMLSWYKMEFKQDFIKALHEFKRLPDLSF